MTSVPKPLKFLRAHYEGLKTQYGNLPASNANRPALADVLSVLAITSGKEGERESLHYRSGLGCSCTLPSSSAARRCAASCCQQVAPQVGRLSRSKQRAWPCPWRGHSCCCAGAALSWHLQKCVPSAAPHPSTAARLAERLNQQSGSDPPTCVLQAEGHWGRRRLLGQRVRAEFGRGDCCRVPR